MDGEKLKGGIRHSFIRAIRARGKPGGMTSALHILIGFGADEIVRFVELHGRERYEQMMTEAKNTLRDAEYRAFANLPRPPMTPVKNKSLTRGPHVFKVHPT